MTKGRREDQDDEEWDASLSRRELLIRTGQVAMVVGSTEVVVTMVSGCISGGDGDGDEDGCGPMQIGPGGPAGYLGYRRGPYCYAPGGYRPPSYAGNYDGYFVGSYGYSEPAGSYDNYGGADFFSAAFPRYRPSE